MNNKVRKFSALILAIFLIWLFSIEAYSANLKTFEIHRTSKGPVFIHYNPDICTLINKDVTDYQGSNFYTVQVAKVEILPDKKEQFLIEYSEGGSVDPGFIIYKVEKTGLIRLSYLIDGLNIAVPGDGFLYIWGHTNSYFNLRRVYSIVNGTLKEIKQPYYYVGLKSEALVEIKIYKSKNEQELVTAIKKGSPITVILNDGDHYLIKTERDILGWWKPGAYSVYEGKEIKDIFFNGD